MTLIIPLDRYRVPGGTRLSIRNHPILFDQFIDEGGLTHINSVYDRDLNGSIFI